MICHKIGCSPISIMGLGFKWLSSEMRVPNPPAKMTTFIGYILSIHRPAGLTPGMASFLNPQGVKKRTNNFYYSIQRNLC